MRADEPITSSELWDMDGCGEVREYINQLRVERLMAKARYFETEAEINERDFDELNCYDDWERHKKCIRIAEALEARARRIKEGM